MCNYGFQGLQFRSEHAYMSDGGEDVQDLALGSWASSAEQTERIRDDVTHLYETRSIVVFRTALGLTQSVEEAEDITQEVFLRLYLALRKGEPIRNMVEWLVVAAKHLALDKLKRSKRHTPVTDVLVARLKNPEERLVDASYYEMWVRMRDRLTPVDRNCLELFSRGATFREISASLGLPYKDAIVRTKRAMDRFRRFIGEGRR